MSSDSTRLSLSVSGTSPLTMRCASPSTIAVLPTPGSPISTGLFLVRRCRTWIARRISSSRPITGSSLPCARALGQVERVLLQRLALAFGFLRVDVCAAAHGLDRRFERLAGQAVLARAAGRRRTCRRPAPSRNISLAMNWSPRLLRFLVGQVEQVDRVAADLISPPVPSTFGRRSMRALQRRLQRRHVDAGALQQRARAAVVLVQQRREQVLRLDVLVVVAERQALRVGQRLLEFGGQFVETHGFNLR